MYEGYALEVTVINAGIGENVTWTGGYWAGSGFAGTIQDVNWRCILRSIWSVCDLPGGTYTLHGAYSDGKLHPAA